MHVNRNTTDVKKQTQRHRESSKVSFFAELAPKWNVQFLLSAGLK